MNPLRTEPGGNAAWADEAIVSALFFVCRVRDVDVVGRKRGVGAETRRVSGMVT